jgi:hypothetical protein
VIIDGDCVEPRPIVSAQPDDAAGHKRVSTELRNALQHPLFVRLDLGEAMGSVREHLEALRRALIHLLRRDLCGDIIETYRARALEKLGLTSWAALMRYALEQKWLHTP